jgi:hypothetical protein
MDNNESLVLMKKLTQINKELQRYKNLNFELREQVKHLSLSTMTRKVLQNERHKPIDINTIVSSGGNITITLFSYLTKSQYLRLSSTCSFL